MHYLINRTRLLSLCRKFHICKKNLTSGNHGLGFSAERLVHRKLVRISGDSSSEFLQGLITNDMRYLERDQPSLYCMFLNTKGRVLFESIIYRTKDKNVFYIECDGQCISQLTKHLSIYKVRRKIDISSVDTELSTWAIYNVDLINQCCLDDGRKNCDSKDFTFDTSVITNEHATVVPDPRLPFLGYRAIIKKGEDITCLPKSDCYNIIRYKLGIGEGIDEFQVGQSFPLEMNCDYLNGVSFDKGCYIGQELTARTFHTGVIRKRLMPILFKETPTDIPFNTSIDDPDVQRKTPLGKLKAIKGNYGLGLMRVTETLAAKTLKVLDYAVKPFTPFWWPDLLQLNKSSSLNK